MNDMTKLVVVTKITAFMNDKSQFILSELTPFYVNGEIKSIQNDLCRYLFWSMYTTEFGTQGPGSAWSH